jgi:hypothetical protein
MMFQVLGGWLGGVFAYVPGPVEPEPEIPPVVEAPVQVASSNYALTPGYARAARRMTPGEQAEALILTVRN